jgi:integrase
MLGTGRICREWRACRCMGRGATLVLPPKNQGVVEPPMAERLTRAKIEKFVSAGVPAGKSEAVLWDSVGTGLGIRVRTTGSTAWIFVYRPKDAGRSEPSRKVTIGSWPSVSLDVVRAAARMKAGEVASGADPAVSFSRERRVLRATLDEFERVLKRRKIVNAKTVMSTLRRGLAPLLTREIASLERKHIVERVDALETEGKPGAAMDLRKHARSLLEWAVTKGLVPYNVLAGLRRPRASRAERLEDESKGRALSDGEIKTLWIAAETLGAFGGLIRLAVLTAMRRSELSGLKWSDVHDERIVIEAHVAKTGARHEIPLTIAMRAVLSAQPRTTSPLVFPGRGGGRMAGWSKLVPRAQRESSVDFRLHDLRRTGRTIMSRCGVAEDVAELAIGHLRRGLVGTYNKDSAWAARVDAFERVSIHIATVVAKSDDASASVVPL